MGIINFYKAYVKANNLDFENSCGVWDFSDFNHATMTVENREKNFCKIMNLFVPSDRRKTTYIC